MRGRENGFPRGRVGVSPSPFQRGHPATPRCAARFFFQLTGRSVLQLTRRSRSLRFLRNGALPLRRDGSPSAPPRAPSLDCARCAGPSAARAQHALTSECRRRGAAFLVMHIESTSHEPPFRTGTLKGLTLSEIQAMLPDIQPDTRPSADRKVTIMWRFTANTKPCGIWNYRQSYEVRGELSTFGPDGVLDTLFGKAYAPD